MAIVDLESTAAALVADGKGILAADETPKTLTKRLDALNIHSTPDTRRSYREMLFGARGIARLISGVIMQDETIHQQSSMGTPFADMLTQQGIIPGIKVDAGAKRLAGTTSENITEGRDGLRDRLKDYAQMGARFAKWRAVIHIDDTLPTHGCALANAHAGGQNHLAATIHLNAINQILPWSDAGTTALAAATVNRS
jgi:fructose-bisphosphate aldolase class I